MTKIKYRAKLIWHETGLRDSGTGREILVSETPASLMLRLKGTRKALPLAWNLAYLRAAMLEAATQREIAGKKKASRKVRRGAFL